MIYDYYLQQHMFIFIYEKTKTFLQHLRFRLSPSCQKKNAYIVQMKKTFFFLISNILLAFTCFCAIRCWGRSSYHRVRRMVFR